MSFIDDDKLLFDITAAMAAIESSLPLYQHIISFTGEIAIILFSHRSQLRAALSLYAGYTTTFSFHRHQVSHILGQSSPSRFSLPQQQLAFRLSAVARVTVSRATASLPHMFRCLNIGTWSRCCRQAHRRITAFSGSFRMLRGFALPIIRFRNTVDFYLLLIYFGLDSISGSSTRRMWISHSPARKSYRHYFGFWSRNALSDTPSALRRCLLDIFIRHAVGLDCEYYDNIVTSLYSYTERRRVSYFEWRDHSLWRAAHVGYDTLSGERLQPPITSLPQWQ